MPRYYYRDDAGRSCPISWHGDIDAALDYIKENLESDDPADHIRAATAQREVDALHNWLDNLPDSGMDIRRVIG